MAEARDLIERLLEDRMTSAEAARFEALVRDSREVRRLYLRTMNLVSNLPHYVVAHEWILGDETTDIGETPKPSMGEAMVLPALHEQDLTDDPPPMRMPEQILPQPQPAPTPWTRWAAAAAVLAVAGLLGWGVLGQRTPVPRIIKSLPRPPASAPVVDVPPVVEPPKWVHLTATAGVAWADGVVVRPGTILEPGRHVAFDAGAVEVVFGTGARVVIEGPASFQVTDSNHARLDYGKLVARVPQAGRGFGVHFGDRTVTDLGTEFGLATGPQHGATVAVFEGEVVLGQSSERTDASTTQPSTRPTEPIHLTAGAVVAATDPKQNWIPVEPSAVQFARTLADVRVPIPSLPATGVGLKDGQPDPHWVVYQESAGESSARPAAMTTTGPPSSTFWVANDPTRSQWLSTAGNLPNVGGGIWIYRTTVDLTGFDPATAVVQADVMVDDALNDVRVNGTSAGLSLPLSSDRTNWRQFHRLTLRGGFKAGRNTIDFAALNGSAKMGLRVEFSGEATPVAVR